MVSKGGVRINMRRLWRILRISAIVFLLWVIFIPGASTNIRDVLGILVMVVGIAVSLFKDYFDKRFAFLEGRTASIERSLGVDSRL